MKNQYFGDINDYRKYGLLRTLQSTGSGRLLVAWMLTPDDGSRDGGFRSYLLPQRWNGQIEPMPRSASFSLQRPHPEKEAKPYQVRDARRFLEQAGIKP